MRIYNQNEVQSYKPEKSVWPDIIGGLLVIAAIVVWAAVVKAL